MKIIATDNESSYLVQANANELCQLMGYASSWAAKRQTDRPSWEPTVGAEIHVSRMYERLELQAKNQKKLNERAKELRELANCLDGLGLLVPVELGGKGE